MFAETVCVFNKFGFCKFEQTCRDRHIDVICGEDCDTKNCEKRHSQPCKYFVKYNRCKFGDFCKYKHENETFRNEAKQPADEKIDNDLKIFENKIKLLQEQYEKIVAEVKNLKDDILILKTKNEKLEQINNTTFTEGDECQRDDTVLECNECSYAPKADKQLCDNITRNHEEHHIVEVTFVSDSFENAQDELLNSYLDGVPIVDSIEYLEDKSGNIVDDNMDYQEYLFKIKIDKKYTKEDLEEEVLIESVRKYEYLVS